MISKGDWGIGYLAGTGVSLVVVLVWWFAIRRQPEFTTFVGTTTGVILAGSLVYLAYWLSRSELRDEHVWAVSQWGAIGLAIPTIPILGVLLFGLDAALRVEASVLVNIAAASAVIGALFGAVTELEDEHIRVLSLNRRNVVLNRVLRHDVRNDVGVLYALADRLEEEFDQAGAEFADPIRRKADEMVAVSEVAKRVEELDPGQGNQSIDVVDVVEDRVDTVRRIHPAVDIETDLPESAWVTADELCDTVVDNVVQNAVEHNDGHPEVRISVRREEGSPGWVEISVADNGPGIPADTARTLSRRDMPTPEETPPGMGLGLWLVKWFVDSYDGELAVDDNDSRGTIVRITLPGAAPGG